MNTTIDVKARRIIYWSWPFLMLAIGMAVGVYYEYIHVNTVARRTADQAIAQYAYQASIASCRQLRKGRFEGNNRAKAVIALQLIVTEFARDASAARAAGGSANDKLHAVHYSAYAKKASQIKIHRLPAIRCVRGKPVEVRQP